MSGGDEQQRDTGGRRGWWLVASLALIGAGVGAYAGYRLDPDVQELIPSLAAAGLGLGGLIGLLLLAPSGLWRAWRRRARRRAAVPAERVDGPEDAGLWHAGEPEDEAAPGPPEPEPVEVEEPPEEEPAPPGGAEPGWYPDPRSGERRYWDGHAWTGHVWRGRTRERKTRR